MKYNKSIEKVHEYFYNIMDFINWKFLYYRQCYATLIRLTKNEEEESSHLKRKKVLTGISEKAYEDAY